MNSNSIALVEIGGSHDECLLSQINAIKTAGHRVVLICTDDIKSRNPLFDTYVDEFYIINSSLNKTELNKEIKKIWGYLKATKVKKVIINTAQGKLIRNLCLHALFNKIEFIGIVHTTRKFKRSFTQTIISWKIKKYLLLSEYLLSTINPPKGVKMGYFYPLRFNNFNKSIRKKTTTVTIIGGVENRRKDLTGFLKLLMSVEDLDVTFVFLGQSSQKDEEVISFRKKLKQLNLSDKVVMFDEFISQDDFDAYLRNTDLIMPLVHPNSPSSDQYFKNQISGAMNVSFGYKIPLMLHEQYAHIVEMAKASFYYNEENFSHVLIESLNANKNKSEEMHADHNYNIQKQEDRYSKFIFSNDEI